MSPGDVTPVEELGGGRGSPPSVVIEDSAGARRMKSTADLGGADDGALRSSRNFWSALEENTESSVLDTQCAILTSFDKATLILFRCVFFELALGRNSKVQAKPKPWLRLMQGPVL